MIKKIIPVLQISAVFIGTIVGAGLASGKEITQFFTSYGTKSFIGLIICMLIYILAGRMIVAVSIKYNLKSYRDLINLVMPNVLGKFIQILLTCFFLCSASIIVAGSGALISQYAGVSHWVGTIFIVSIAFLALLRKTTGLVEVNSFIVPCLITIITLIFCFYIIYFPSKLNLEYIKNSYEVKKHWLASAMVYGSFNIFCCSGVLVPLSSESKNKNVMVYGITLGAIGLTIISIIINLLLMVNIPGILKYEIPLLFVAHPFGKIIQCMLLAVIWLEMFSTEVSDAYSISYTLENILKVDYKICVFLVLCAAVSISLFGFGNLISVIYPAFGVVSFIFILTLTIFYFKNIDHIKI